MKSGVLQTHTDLYSYQSGKSLEEIAALFGDEVVVSSSSAAFDKASAAHDEEMGSVRRVESKA
jgi:hypothetical protein